MELYLNIHSSLLKMTVRDIDSVEVLGPLLKETPLVVLDFHARWCGPCKAATPSYLELATQFPSVVFCKIDLDQADEHIKGIFEVRSIPLFLVIQNDKVIQRLEGYDPQSTMFFITKTLLQASPDSLQK
jgi:thioredoxin 1